MIGIAAKLMMLLTACVMLSAPLSAGNDTGRRTAETLKTKGEELFHEGKNAAGKTLDEWAQKGKESLKQWL